jgi:replicative DNA helicase
MRKTRHTQQPEQGLGHLFDTQTEALILGGILTGGEPVLRTVSFLSLDDFSLERHRIIFRAITDIALDVEPTLDAVAHRLIETERLEAADGLSALVDIHAHAIPDIGLVSFAVKLQRQTRDRRAFKLGKNYQSCASRDSGRIAARRWLLPTNSGQSRKLLMVKLREA